MPFENLNLYQGLTQIVNDFQERAQFQGVRCYRSTTGLWLVRLEFFPKPQRLNFFVADGQIQAGTIPRLVEARFKLASNPLALYLKAHFLNLRLEMARAEAGVLILKFLGTTAELRFESTRPATLTVRADVPDRKPFALHLKLETLEAAAFLPEAPEPSEPERETAAPASATSPAQKKRDQLVANVQRDLEAGRRWLAEFAPVLSALQADAGLWAGNQLEHREQIDALKKELKIYGETMDSGVRRQGLERAFQLRKRAERKVRGAELRLKEIEKRPLGAGRAIASATATTEQSGQGRRARAESESATGRSVELIADPKHRVVALYGRNAVENGELFRRAKSRDVWFHVRGQAGGHVWIGRGQPGFGAKVDLSENLIQMGCQLALINSKSKRSGSAVVDFTERRFLKAIKGQGPGQLSIQRSETRSIRLDTAFEQRFKVALPE